MKKKTTQTTSSPIVVDTYETEIEYTCPVRGKVKQKVRVKRLEKVNTTLVNEILPNKSLAEKLDVKYSGLTMSDDSLEEEPEGVVE